MKWFSKENSQRSGEKFNFKSDFFKRDIEELAADEGKTEIEYLNSIDNNLSGGEVVLIKVSNSITSKIGTLLKLVRSIRKDRGSGFKRSCSAGYCLLYWNPPYYYF